MLVNVWCSSWHTMLLQQFVCCFIESDSAAIEASSFGVNWFKTFSTALWCWRVPCFAFCKSYPIGVHIHSHCTCLFAIMSPWLPCCIVDIFWSGTSGIHLRVWMHLTLFLQFFKVLIDCLVCSLQVISTWCTKFIVTECAYLPPYHSDFLARLSISFGVALVEFIWGSGCT